MRPVFVATANATRFEAALKALEHRGASEACLMVVDGVPGVGKTTTLHRWATQNSALFLRAKKEWTPSWFLDDLLKALRLVPQHSFKRRHEQALTGLIARQSQMVLQHRTFAVIIDEADHVSRSGRIIESIRDFADIGDIVFVLVGMGKIRSNLAHFPQVASRVAQYVGFEPAGREDVRLFVDGLCEVPVGDDLVDFLHRASGGFNREIKEGIASIERWGKRNGGGPATLPGMAGQLLLNDRRSGTPIHVPALS
jgi:hypothetical protein